MDSPETICSARFLAMRRGKNPTSLPTGFDVNNKIVAVQQYMDLISYIQVLSYMEAIVISHISSIITQYFYDKDCFIFLYFLQDACRYVGR